MAHELVGIDFAGQPDVVQVVGGPDHNAWRWRVRNSENESFGEFKLNIFFTEQIQSVTE
jgi:hypothetical protein